MMYFEKTDVYTLFYQYVIASIINTIKMINYSIHHDIKLCSYSVNDSCSLSCIVEMYWYWIFCFIYCYKYNYKLLPCNKYELDWLGWNRLLASLKKTTLSITSFILLFMQGTKEVYSLTQLSYNRECYLSSKNIKRKNRRFIGRYLYDNRIISNMCIVVHTSH